jgi:general secretion pathway protein B
MSLILDALKKSERERHRDKAPGLQSIHQPLPRREAPSRRHFWLIGGVVVTINVVALVYWRLQAPAAPAATNAVAEQPAAKTDAVATLPSVANSSTSAGKAALSGPVVDEFTKISPAQSAAPQPSVRNDLRVEEVSELPDDVRNNLPAMTFSFHVYSANAQQRTIIINNRRMREGDEVAAGLLLQEITEDGVILLTAGHRLHISVLSGW